ncbi:MAG: hypothetical protein GVY35_10040, partial [Bacteroidetes bacterium]|nr:hypothetical protein [Bacteroidota bacterium]
SHPLAAELAAERRKTAALQKRLEQAEAIIEVQKNHRVPAVRLWAEKRAAL